MSEVEVVTSTDEPEIVELCQLYWLFDQNGGYSYTVKELAERFNLTVYQVNQVVRRHSEAYSTSVKCSLCGQGFLVQSRAELSNLGRKAGSLCDECLREREQVRKNEAAQLAEARRQSLYQSFRIVESGDIDFDRLELRQAITLAALLRGGEDSENGVIVPACRRVEKLAPTAKLQTELLRSVFEDQLIRIHPESDLDSFDWEDESTPPPFYLTRATYYLAGTGGLPGRVTRYRSIFENILSQKEPPRSWAAESSDFWLEVAAAECISYLVFCLTRHNLDFNPGEQTEITVRKGLQWFSIGQLFNLIWRAARDAAAYKTRDRVPGKQAANSAVTRLRSSIERAYAEGWTVKPYRRDTRHGVSTVSHLLFTGFLQLPDPLSFNPISENISSTQKLSWGKLDAEQFERLIFSLVSETDGYADVNWLMKTNAPDRGRDVGATRLRNDPLSGFSQERLVIQCKHWLASSIRDDDVAKEATSVEHWDNPPVDVLVVATSGKFTADAVSWIERHNSRNRRPKIEMWNDAKLEQLLAERSHLILSFELR